MGARRLGQDEQYLTVREILSEASTRADGVLSRERSDFYRFGCATLGFKPNRNDSPFLWGFPGDLAVLAEQDQGRDRSFFDGASSL